MSTTIFYRRRAERFAQLLDEANGGRHHHVHSGRDEDLAELVEIGHRVSAAQPTAEVDPDFRTGLRAMLLATAEREGIGATAATEPETADGLGRSTRFGSARVNSIRPALTARRARARGAVIVGVAVGAIAVSGISAASGNAVPGDALYGVKRSTERAQLALASSEVTRGQLFLDFARTRLAEAQALQGDKAGFAAVLSDMDGDTRQGVRLLTTSAVQRKDAAALDAIAAFLTGQRQQIADMVARLTGADRERALASLALLDSIDKRADGLRRSLACGSNASTGSDQLGPLPRFCGSALNPAGSRPGKQQEQSRGGSPGPVNIEKTSPDASPPTPVAGGPTAAVAFTGPSSSAPDKEDGLLDQLGRLIGDILG